jgi:Pretoxin HINT domain
MLTGNFQGIDSAFMRSSELNGALFSLGAEVIAGALEEYQNDPPGVKGYKVGRVVFEVLAILLPISKAGKLAQLHKSELLTKVLNANVLPQRLVPKMNVLKNALSVTKMCFVASTLVLCQVEGAARLEPIGGLESLAGAHPELKVWARDEFTGEEGWKRPIAWFTTHPEELFTLGVDSDGDGETDEELTGTGEHPFWVEAYRSFVPMRDLRPGMRLALAQKGKVAIVTGNVSKRGPPGETFTTYNFEVEDFHTYFVGEAGVWVHNTGAPCERIFSAFYQKAKDLGGTANLRAERFNVLKETKLSLAADKSLPDASWAQSSREVSAKMLDDFANGKITDVDNIPTVNNWNNSFFRAASRKVAKVDTEVHHIVPEALVTQFKGTGTLPPSFGKGGVPGHSLTKEIHRGLSDAMNPMLNNQAFRDLPDSQKARQIVDFYKARSFDSEAAVAEAWFKKNGIW